VSKRKIRPEKEKIFKFRLTPRFLGKKYWGEINDLYKIYRKEKK